MEICKQQSEIENPTRDLNIWLCGRKTQAAKRDWNGPPTQISIYGYVGGRQI